MIRLMVYDWYIYDYIYNIWVGLKLGDTQKYPFVKEDNYHNPWELGVHYSQTNPYQ